MSDRVFDQEVALAELEHTVESFATQINELLEAGVSQAVIFPRLMLAFRQHFGGVPINIPGIPGVSA